MSAARRLCIYVRIGLFEDAVLARITCHSVCGWRMCIKIGPMIIATVHQAPPDADLEIDAKKGQSARENSYRPHK
jgi:hypothetical protein